MVIFVHALALFRAIDTVLCTSAGIQFFISEKEIEMKTGYEKILGLLSSLQHSRAKVRFCSFYCITMVQYNFANSFLNNFRRDCTIAISQEYQF